MLAYNHITSITLHQLTLSGARRGCEAKGANFNSRLSDPLGEYGGAFGLGPYLLSALT